jgi:hypothetical protein
MEAICSPKRRIELELHGTKSQKAPVSIGKTQRARNNVSSNNPAATSNLIDTANVVLRWMILSTLKMEAADSFKTSFLTRPVRHIPQGSILKVESKGF